MSLKKKLIILFCFCIFISGLFNVLIYNFYIRQTIYEVEKKYILEASYKLRKIINKEKDSLLNLTKYWATQTDSWLYMQGKTTSFKDINLKEETLINNKVHLVAFIDIEGNIKTEVFYDEFLKRTVNFDEDMIKNYIVNFLSFYKDTKEKSGFVGLTFKKEAPFIVAIHPIFNGDHSGLLAGYLVTGRLINVEEEEFIKELLGIKNLKIADIESLQDIKQNEIILSGMPLIKEKKDGYLITDIIKDFYGKSTIVLSFELPKKLNMADRKVFLMIVINFTIWSLFGILLYIIINKKLLGRLEEIITDLKEVEAGHKDTVKILIKDEIGYLTEEINKYISKVKEQILEIEENRKIYQVIAEKSEEIIVLFNKQGNIIFANLKAIEYLGGEKFDISLENLRPFIQDILKLTDEEMTFWREIKLQDGTFLTAWIVPVEEKTGTMLLIAHDVTFFKKEKDKLFEIATKDPLTSLYNRNFFEDSLKKTINSAKRGDFFSLLFIDMDDLKKINDQFGHIAGDTTIRATAKAIIKSVRESDLAARWGGDEFAVIIKGGIEQAKTVAERIQMNLKKISLSLAQKTITPSVSIGITIIDGTKDAESLIKKADQATYEAKKEGKNRIKVVSE